MVPSFKLPSLPVTLAELKAILAGDMLTDWQKKADCSDERLEEFLRGIPVEWAQQFARTFRSMPVTRWPKLIHPPKLLHSGGVKSRVKANMHAQHKLAISEGRATRDKKFKLAIRKSKFTQAALAQAVGMKESLLSMCRSGERAMYLSRAKRVEDLTGWPADKAHWPGGIVEDA